MERKTPSSVLLFGWLYGLLISFGVIFKTMHWPGASMLLIFGSLFFLLFYLPLWFINESKKGRWLGLVSQLVYLFFTSFTFLFKTMHWPGGGIFFNVWLYSTFLIVTPISLVLLF